jgi:carboxypeptidase C (cathepsin A)
VTVRYKSIPGGACELNLNVKSYSGYADIPNANQSIFWMFEARNVDPATVPLTIRLDRGPGASSMNGLFQEIGPCAVDGKGNVVDDVNSWSNISNMLFIGTQSFQNILFSKIDIFRSERNIFHIEVNKSPDQPTEVDFSY